MISFTVLLAALASFAAFIAICLFLPIRMTRGQAFPSPLFEAVDNSRKTLAQIFGGAAIVLTFAWSFSKDSETLEQARRQNANQQYISSAQMLAESNSVATRTAGIFSMGEVARTRSEYHMPVRDVFQAFLSRRSDPVPSEISRHPPRIDADRQAAIYALGRRNLANDDQTRWLNLSYAYMIGANFNSLKGFNGASFQSAALSGADFRAADLSGAWMDGARMADYQGYGHDWNDSVPLNGEWEKWEKYLYIANFTGANLVGASLTGADLCGAVFTEADLAGADFRRSILSRADFTGAKHLLQARFSNDDGSESACADVPPKFDKGIDIKIPICK